MNSNPLQMMIQMSQKQQRPQNLPIDPQRFCQMAPKLTKENLVQLAQQARAQGIPDEQIEQGLNFLLNLKYVVVRKTNYFWNIYFSRFLLQ